ncbi:hydrogenase expression/formation C-terminal domain-containing protein [Magnetovibrio sp. PR-2]|uniref:hydrogenase expression/formation C-terminal domain-containing protein n=1 Tax=Magnetovibrio sp. PR-2 TaxID=3120356 RepID=UPI002FCDECF3
MDCKIPQSNTSAEMDEILSFVETGNAPPLLNEILHALTALIETGQETTIDLGAMPFATGDERIFNDILGTGEVSCVLTVLGESRIHETAIPGVWRIEHFDENGEYQSRFIEITFIPQILKTQPEDAERGVRELAERISELNTKD